MANQPKPKGKTEQKSVHGKTRKDVPQPADIHDLGGAKGIQQGGGQKRDKS